MPRHGSISRTLCSSIQPAPAIRVCWTAASGCGEHCSRSTATSPMAEGVRHWLDHFERNVSPKYLLGESYSGFRAPRIAQELSTSQATGVSGLVLILPKLDFGHLSAAFNPLSFATLLP